MQRLGKHFTVKELLINKKCHALLQNWKYIKLFLHCISCILPPTPLFSLEL